MNVLVIEPPLFMFEKFEKEAKHHDDKLYYVIKKHLILKIKTS